MRVDYIEGEKNSFTFFVSNDLKVKKYNSKRQTLLTDIIKREIIMESKGSMKERPLNFIIIAPMKTDSHPNRSSSKCRFIAL